MSFIYCFSSSFEMYFLSKYPENTVTKHSSKRPQSKHGNNPTRWQCLLIWCWVSNARLSKSGPPTNERYLVDERMAVVGFFLWTITGIFLHWGNYALQKWTLNSGNTTWPNVQCQLCRVHVKILNGRLQFSRHFPVYILQEF